MTKVAMSKPLTLRSEAQLPDGFMHIADEGKLSYTLGRIKRRPFSEQQVQAIVFWRLLRARGWADVLVTGRYGDSMALFQGVFTMGRRPLVLMDVEWPNRRNSGLRRSISIILHRILANGAVFIQVFCHSEIQEYADYFGINPSKFQWIPYCVDENDDCYPCIEGDYIFTGGHHGRDYKTLFQAVKGLPCEVRLAAPPHLIPPSPIPDNVTILGRVMREEFFEQMAGAKLIVVPLQPGAMRSPGVITYVYGMKYGKCVIVSDPIGASSYIHHEKTGLLVNPEDANALRQAILHACGDKEFRRTLGQNAQIHYQENFTFRRYFSELERLVADCARKAV